MLHGNEIVTHIFGGLFGFVEAFVNVLGNIDGVSFPAASCDLRHLADKLGKIVCYLFRIRTHSCYELRDKTVFLSCKCVKQVLLLDVHVLEVNGGALCFVDRFDRFFGKLLRIHKHTSFPKKALHGGIFAQYRDEQKPN